MSSLCSFLNALRIIVKTLMWKQNWPISSSTISHFLLPFVNALNKESVLISISWVLMYHTLLNCNAVSISISFTSIQITKFFPGMKSEEKKLVRGADFKNMIQLLLFQNDIWYVFTSDTRENILRVTNSIYLIYISDGRLNTS